MPSGRYLYTEAHARPEARLAAEGWVRWDHPDLQNQLRHRPFLEGGEPSWVFEGEGNMTPGRSSQREAIAGPEARLAAEGQGGRVGAKPCKHSRRVCVGSRLTQAFCMPHAEATL
jgi:hypothetical protein